MDKESARRWFREVLTRKAMASADDLMDAADAWNVRYDAMKTKLGQHLFCFDGFYFVYVSSDSRMLRPVLVKRVSQVFSDLGL
jgi:hypothetical protein